MDRLEKAVKNLDWRRALLWRDMNALRSEDPGKVAVAESHIEQWRKELGKAFKEVRNLLAKEKAFTVWCLIFALAFTALPPSALAVNTSQHGDMSGKSVVAGILSLFVWPGIGQVVNENETKKVVTHAILGLTVVFRLWSGWDALIARQGGRWDGKI